jgi:hypothetical protein
MQGAALPTKRTRRNAVPPGQRPALIVLSGREFAHPGATATAPSSWTSSPLPPSSTVSPSAKSPADRSRWADERLLAEITMVYAKAGYQSDRTVPFSLGAGAAVLGYASEGGKTYRLVLESCPSRRAPATWG